MRPIIHIILAFMFLVAGVSQVPACYATKPDCNFKAATGCPMVKARPKAAADKTPPCCLLDQQPAEKQKPTASFPLDRFKRLKVEQIQYDTTVFLSFVPGFITNIIFELPKTHLSNNLFAHRFDNPHHHPPPLFIQHQSFLI